MNICSVNAKHSYKLKLRFDHSYLTNDTTILIMKNTTHNVA